MSERIFASKPDMLDRPGGDYLVSKMDRVLWSAREMLVFNQAALHKRVEADWPREGWRPVNLRSMLQRMIAQQYVHTLARGLYTARTPIWALRTGGKAVDMGLQYDKPWRMPESEEDFSS